MHHVGHFYVGAESCGTLAPLSFRPRWFCDGVQAWRMRAVVVGSVGCGGSVMFCDDLRDARPDAETDAFF
eukprot:7250489-Prymnesium_polylepis.3